MGERAQAATRLSTSSVCPGTGVRLVSRTYKVRPVTDEDREQYARFERYSTERGDADEAEYYRSVIPKWESEVGQEREALVCAVCGRTSLSPTRAGTARRHQRWDTETPSWDRVYQLRKEINALNEELDRVLAQLDAQSEA
jgi:hypothetical protein